MAKKQKPMLDPVKFGLAAGILWGVIMLLMTLIASGTGYGTELLNLIATIYPGYAITFGGAIIGLIYGFLDGFIGMWLLIWLYNWLCK